MKLLNSRLFAQWILLGKLAIRFHSTEFFMGASKEPLKCFIEKGRDRVLHLKLTDDIHSLVLYGNKQGSQFHFHL